MEIDHEASLAALPRVLPAGWVELRDYGLGVFAKGRTRVIMGVERHDAELWLHVSVSERKSLPRWSTMVEVKRIFIGPQRKAISVLPSDNEWINTNQFVLHLWARLDAPIPIPDFRRDSVAGPSL